MKPVIEVRNLVKKVGEHKIIDLEQIDFYNDKIYAVLGENGAGKSTLLRLISNCIPPDEGNITCNLSDIAYLPQKPYLFDFSVKKNMELAGAKKDEIMERLHRVGLDKIADRNAKKLSGGERQRLALARLLCSQHHIILLDEPTTAMDISGISLVEEELLRYQDSNHSTILMITHDLAQAKRMSDVVIFMSEGGIISSGTFDDVFANANDVSIEKFIKYYKL